MNKILDKFIQAKGAIFEIEHQLPYDSPERQAFYRTRVALSEAFNTLQRRQPELLKEDS